MVVSNERAARRDSNREATRPRCASKFSNAGNEDGVSESSKQRKESDSSLAGCRAGEKGAVVWGNVEEIADEDDEDSSGSSSTESVVCVEEDRNNPAPGVVLVSVAGKWCPFGVLPNVSKEIPLDRDCSNRAAINKRC
jgi:hypothetical protein